LISASRPDHEPDRWDFFAAMQLIRTLEERLLDLFGKGLLTGTTHTSIGQESCAVGVIWALDRTRDVVFSSHRCHGHYLALHDAVERLVAEVMGRATGTCGGVGGSQHLCDENFYTSGVQGGIAAAATGVAFAEKLKRTGAIAVPILGDGTMGQGVVYESLNMASLWNLPVLFVVELNGWAQTTPTQLAAAGDLHERARPFGIECRRVRADDVAAVYAAAKDAVRVVRETMRPVFLAIDTYRLGPHSKGDDTRSAEELAPYVAADPLARLRSALESTDGERVASVVEAARARIDRAVATATEAPAGALREALERVAHG
jgi:TPP-dependent pyruvate/acetoin dehydrogenase alpha subunit